MLLNPPLTAQDFDPEAFMDKFKDRFLQSVDSHAIVLRLEIEKVISKELSHNIKKQHIDGGNEELFLYLQRHADLEGIRNLCDVMNIDGYPKMSKLGRDMKEYLYLLTSMYEHVKMYMYVPLYVYMCAKPFLICGYIPMYVHAITCDVAVLQERW